jgi:DNA-binding winged helix-turn-helix (wHTH) protein
MGTETSSRAREGGEVHFLRFGVFEMDIRAGELRRNGSLVRLQPQPFKVLAMLAGRPGDVVTREEVQTEVWPAGTFVDFEQSLNFCIRQIRSALGDSAIHPRYVETLPRRGYRWVGGAVERVGPPATIHEWPRPVSPEPTNGGGAVADVGSGAVSRAGSGWRWVALAAVLAAVLVTGLAAWKALHVQPAATPPEFQRVTFRRGAVTSARFGPEGQIVYVASWEGQPWSMQLVGSGARESRPLDIPEARIQAVSASEVAFIHKGVLARAPLAGGPPREVLKDVAAADWNADFTEFAVVRPVGRRFHLEYPIGRDLGVLDYEVNRVRISPDGERLALEQRVMPHDDRGRVVIVDRDGKQLLATDEFASLCGVAWSPHGDEVWFTAARVGAENSLHALSLDGHVRTVYAAMGRLVLHDVARDGRVLLERTASRVETFFRREGQKEDRDLSWLDFSGVEGMSADGSQVLLVESGEGGGPDYTSYLRRTDGSLPVKLGPGMGTALSADGKWVLVIPLRKPDHVEIVPTGPGEARRVQIPNVARHERAGWMPDGKSLWVSTRDAAGVGASWLVDLQGGKPRRLPLPEGRALFYSTFSPDGKRFAARCPDTAAICVYQIAGGKPQPIPGAQESWIPIAWDDTGLYVRDYMKDIPETFRRLDPKTGRVEVVAEITPRDTAGALGLGRVIVADSGRAWAYSVFRQLSDLYVVTGLH